MFEGCYDMDMEDTLEGVFYLFAIKPFGGAGFTHKQSNQLRSEALWWWADIAVKANALSFIAFLVENLETFVCEHTFALPICS